MSGTFLGIAMVAAMMLAACQTVPITGRSQLQLLGERTEVQMGLSAYQDALKKEKISGDTKLNEQVSRLGRRIAEATGKTDYQWEFKLVENDKMVNAFCLSGGIVLRSDAAPCGIIQRFPPTLPA